MPDDAAPLAPWTLTYAQLKAQHPEYRERYWRQCRALTSGGSRLLDDAATLHELFPPHTDEEKRVHDERKSRAFYIPYPGEIVGDLVGQLAQDPVRVDADPKPEPFYAKDFFENVDGRGMTLTAYAQNRVREALQVRVAWTLVDLPARDELAEEEVRSVADEERLGLLRPYVVPLAAEAVTDWEEDDDGCLVWACVRRCATRRVSPVQSRGTIVETFTFYTATEWARFELVYEEGKEPKDTDPFTPTKKGRHSFGCVPLVRLELPDGLWALDKLHSIARAHFNQRNAFSWAQFKHLFPLLTAFLGPEMGGGGGLPSEAQQVPTRATDQVYGTGRVHVFGKDDKLTYTAPPADVFTVAADDLKSLRDEMHRVTSMMASTIDNTAAAVGRSGESKQQDKSSREIVLAAIGVIALDHLRDLLDLVAAGRGETPPAWSLQGFTVFDSVSASEAIADAAAVDALTIPSPTFWRIYRATLAARILRHDATPDELAKIRKEIEANTPDEDFDTANRPTRIPPTPSPNGGDDDEEDEEGEGGDDETRAAGRPAARAAGGNTAGG